MISEHFKREEFACRCGCGFDVVDVELLSLAEDLRFTFDAFVTLNSACRCAAHNRAVGGSPKSQHLMGKAGDFVVAGYAPEKVYKYLDQRYPNKFGFGLYKTFVHADVRAQKTRWDNQKPGAES